MPLLDVAERHQLAVEYNSAPELQAPGSLQPLPQQLAATAARWPDAVALATAHGEAVTYGLRPSTGPRYPEHTKYGVEPSIGNGDFKFWVTNLIPEYLLSEGVIQQSH